MTTTLKSIAPGVGTYSVARPPILFTVTSDDPDRSVVIQYWISTSPTPKTDPNAYSGLQTVTVTFSGFSADTSFPMQLADSVGLVPGNWNITGELRDAGTNAILGTITQAFTISFVPSAVALTPATGEARQFVATANNLILSWDFVGKEGTTDAPTAYQVIVKRVSDNLVIVDTGKVVSTNKQAIVTITNTYTDVQLTWQVRVWNKWDTPSVYTTGNTFYLTLTYTLNITSPTNNQVMSAGNPNLTVTVTTSGGRTTKKIIASAFSGNTKIWEKTVYGNWATGSSVNITDGGSVFAVGAYSYNVTAQDNLGSYSNAVTRNFSVSYTAPATVNNTPTIVTSANYADLGYIRIGWNDSTRDVDYLCWAIERKDDLIDVNTQAVVRAGAWAEVGRVYTTGASYTFDDYLAPSNYRVSYRIVQVALKWATEVRSIASGVSAYVFPSTEAYWLYAGVNGNPGSMAIKLFNVVSDSLTDEYETAQFTLIGRGRYEERGSHLGLSGSLTMNLRDNSSGTARSKRILLEEFKDLYPKAVLRNPFGDAASVSLGNISIERIAGTGKSEFTNVTIPYLEVIS